MKIRALTFRKRFANIEHKSTWWATLGHTDEMECTESQDMTLLDISAFNNATFSKDSAEAYHHVVYLIDNKTGDDIQSSDSELWKDDGFLSITRIHFPKTIGLQIQFDNLNKHFEKISSEFGVSWRTYYTMELSDMVLVSKSKSLQILAQWSLLATKCELVGKAYTYFCVPGSILNTETSELLNELGEDCIDFVAVRFVIRDYMAEAALSNAWETLGKSITTPPLRVAGNEDAIICGQNIPTLNLMTLYRKWYQDDSIFKVFRDISTRIGSQWNKEDFKPEAAIPSGCQEEIMMEGADQDCDPQNPISEESKQDVALQEHLEEGSGKNENDKKSLEFFSRVVLDKIQNNILVADEHKAALINREWMRPLVELTNALVHMSSSATLDEPVFQILPGLNAFWDNVIEESEPLLDEPLYLRFAELCVHTMEHLMRAEGQLSQRLEVRPLAYDIPVFVLEYVTTFLLTLSDEMTRPDKKDTEKIRFLLFPSAEKDVSTVEPFRANSNTPGLLLITVPFSLLYKPKQLIPALCHEIAHYVGEDLRMRKERYDYILDTATTELLTYFFQDISGDTAKLRKYIKEAFFDKTIREATVDLAECYGDFIKIPLLKITDKICMLAYTLVDTDAYAELVRRYVLSNLRGSRFNSISQQAREERIDKFISRMIDLAISFREAYADICMVHFLRLEPIEYLDAVLHQGVTINSGTVLRTYVVLLALDKTPEDIQSIFVNWVNTNQMDFDDRTQIYNDLNDIANEIDRADYASERLLANYIKQCRDNLKKTCPSNGVKADGYLFTAYDIYEKIQGLNSTTATSYPEILKVIDNGREIALNQLEKDLEYNAEGK